MIPKPKSKLSINKPRRHSGSDELIATLDDPKPGKINMDIGATRKKAFKLLATDLGTSMTTEMKRMIDSYIEKNKQA